MSGRKVYPLQIDPIYAVDLDSFLDWEQAEWLVWKGRLNFVDPASQRRKLPEKIEMVIMDFDGVLTDNRVWVDEEGHEQVASSRSDSMGLALLCKQTGIKAMVLSRETSPVVKARCQKLDLPVMQAVFEKGDAIRKIARDYQIDLKTLFMSETMSMTCHVLHW